MKNPNKGALFIFEVALVLWSRFRCHDTAYIDYLRADELTCKYAPVSFRSFDSLITAPGDYRPSLDVSVPGKLELANTYDAAQEEAGDVRRAFRYGTPARRTTCQNWDSLIPQPVYSSTGQHIGMKMPRMTQAQIAASPGIQGWSAPDTDTRTR